MKIGLVLGAGGSVGVAYHGGVLAAVEEATGWDPRTAEVIVGTSAGSITAAMLRAGVPAGDLAAISEGRPLSPAGERLAQVGRPHRPRPRTSDLLRMRAVADPIGVAQALLAGRPALAPALPAGGIPTTAISAGINAVFAGRWPDRALWICAVDLRTGRRVVFGHPGYPDAPVGSAVAASAAIPGYFSPVSIGGRRYVDGGLRSMVNLDLLAGAGVDLVVVNSPMSHVSSTPWPTASSPVRQLLRARLRAEVTALRQAGLPVVVIEPGRRVVASMGLNPMDARRRGQVSLATRAAVADWLAHGLTGRRVAATLAQAAAATSSTTRSTTPSPVPSTPSTTPSAASAGASSAGAPAAATSAAATSAAGASCAGASSAGAPSAGASCAGASSAGAPSAGASSAATSAAATSAAGASCAGASSAGASSAGAPAAGASSASPAPDSSAAAGA